MIRRHSLWLIPESHATARLAVAIDELARRFGGPRFDPHVTLTGGISAADTGLLPENMNRLIAESLPVTLEAAGIDGGGGYYRSLYVRLARSAELLSLRRRAADFFAEPRPGAEVTDPGADFMPHLSLFYGELSPETRAHLAGELAAALPASFPADSLAIVDTTGEVAEWRVIARGSRS